MITPLEKSITRNQITGMEQPAKILFPATKIGGSVSITNTLRTDTENRNYATIQPTIFHLNQATRPRHSDQDHFPIRNLNSGIDAPISGQNIDNCTGMNPQVPILTTIPYSNRANN